MYIESILNNGYAHQDHSISMSDKSDTWKIMLLSVFLFLFIPK